MKRIVTLILVAVFAAALAVSEETDKKSVIEDGVIDEIRLVQQTFPKGAGVIVRRFSSENANLGAAEKSDNQKRLDATKTIQEEAPGLLAETMVQSLKESGVFPFAGEDAGKMPEGAVVVEGRFVTIDPGSRAKRYWAGFGAGKSGVGVEGVVKNARGEVLAEFKHLKHSGVGMGGGNYLKFLRDDTRDVAKDLAKFLERWAKGQDLRKD